MVMLRRRQEPVQRILSTLALLMTSLWRARLMEDTMLSASLRLSLGCSGLTRSSSGLPSAAVSTASSWRP